MNFMNFAAMAKKKGLSLSKIDPVKEHVKKKLEAFKITDDAEITKVKDLIDKLKTSKTEGKATSDTKKTDDATDEKKDKENGQQEGDKDAKVDDA